MDIFVNRNILTDIFLHVYIDIYIYIYICVLILQRDKNGVDEIRENILRGGLNHPLKFPNGEKILGLVPQIVIG
jgi:hypothetical protein